MMSATLNLSTSKNPAIWRLWAEIIPLLAMIIFTFIFWIIEKKEIGLCTYHELAYDNTP